MKFKKSILALEFLTTTDYSREGIILTHSRVQKTDARKSQNWGENFLSRKAKKLEYNSEVGKKRLLLIKGKNGLNCYHIGLKETISQHRFGI